jgi:chromosome partitioning protein
MDFREHWLNREVITPLKSKYDLIILDCSPNWNNLITNALIASDLIISPLECKIKHFRNFPYFKVHIQNFLKKTNSGAKHFYVATKYVQTKKLSKDIKNWYLKNIPNCFATSIRDSAKAEEACADLLSFPEHVPTDIISQEMREFVSEIWEQLRTDSAHKPRKAAAVLDSSEELR